MKPSELFRFKDTINSAALIFFFLSGRQLKTPASKCNSFSRMMQMNPPDDCLKTR